MAQWVKNPQLYLSMSKNEMSKLLEEYNLPAFTQEEI